jgi:hypothetical protein
MFLLAKVSAAVSEGQLFVLNQNDALTIIFDCVTELNKQLPPAERLAKAENSVLVGHGSALDSLSIITLLVSVEDAVAARGGARVSLLDNPNLTEEHGRFHTLGSLADFVAKGGS